DLVRLAGRGLPLELDPADLLRRAEVHLEPLRVAERAGPAGPGVAVDRVRGRGTGVLHRRGGGRVVQGRVVGAGAAAGARGAVDLELPDAVAVLGAPGRAVHADVPSGP